MAGERNSFNRIVDSFNQSQNRNLGGASIFPALGMGYVFPHFLLAACA